MNLSISPDQKARDKLLKSQRTNLHTTINRLKAQFSFGNIKCWNDVYKIVGYSDEYVTRNFNNGNQQVIITDLRLFFKKLEDDLERSQSYGKTEQEQIKPVLPESRSSSIQSVLPILHKSEGLQETNPKQKNEEEKIINLPPSPNEKAFLYWFQKNAAAKILQGYGVIK